MLKERLLKEVRLNGTCSSGADDDRNDRVLLRVVICRLAPRVCVISADVCRACVNSLQVQQLGQHVLHERNTAGAVCSGPVLHRSTQRQ